MTTVATPISPLAEPEPTGESDPNDRFFGTAHLAKDLKGRSIRGGAVTIGSQAAKFVVTTASTMILARLLSPADFGLVAMASAVTGLVSVIGDFGLSAATIQRAQITHRQVSLLFWIGMGVSLLCSALVAGLAPIIAWFYHEPRLIGITLAIAGTFIFGGLTSQHYALLSRQMRFVAMALVQTVPLLVSVIVGIGLALLGWGYWTIVIMSIVQASGTALVSWIAAGWRPAWPGRVNEARSMLALGGHLTGFNILSYLTRNTDNILIGRFLGAESLGIYSKAYGLLLMPVLMINAPINGVVLPALSRLQNQPERFRNYFLRAVEVLAFIGMPLIAFAFADSELLVVTVLGPKWKAAAPIFRLLAPAALVGTINSAPTWIFTALGKTDRQFLWAAISTPIILGGFAVGLLWGTEGVALSFSITFGICFLLFAYDACRHSPVQFRDLILSLLSPLGASIVAAAIVLVIRLPMRSTPVRLVLDVMLFAIVYSAVSLALPSGRRVVTMTLKRSQPPSAPPLPTDPSAAT